MASSNFIEKTAMDDLEKYEKGINATFDSCIEKLHLRRFVILDELRRKYNDYDSKKLALKKSIAELGNMEKDFENNIHENEIAELRNETLEVLQKKAAELRDKAESSFDFKFSHPSDDSFSEYLEGSFSLVVSVTLEDISNGNNFVQTGHSQIEQTEQKSIDYKTKTIASKVIGKTGAGRGNFNGPMKISFDEVRNLIYVPDGNNSQVQILNADGEFIKQFGRDQFKFPCSVSIEGSYCFVADSAGQTIFKYGLPDCVLMNKANLTSCGAKAKLSFPVDIKADKMGSGVYVADLDNDRVCIFDDDLVFERDFGQDHLKKPQYIQFSNDKIFVLDRGSLNCLHQFNRSRVKERDFLTRGIGMDIVNGKSFCFDSDGNIIIADFDADTVKVFSFIENSVKLIHRIGGVVPHSEVLGGCMGVILIENKLIVSCQSPENCLKVI